MSVVVRCAICGKKAEVSETHKDYKRLVDEPKKVVYVCDLCSNRVRYESEENLKPRKPI